MKKTFLANMWNAYKNFAIIFSFAVNFVLIIVLLLILPLILPAKNQIVEPLLDGLHSNFIAMDDATIRATIPVSANVPIAFVLPIQNSPAVVVLSEPVPLNVPASFTFPGSGGQINGRVALTLQTGTVLPVTINMTVPVETEIPIVLDVPAIIPMSQTELHDPFNNLRLLLEPYVLLIDNTPDTWSEALSLSRSDSQD